MPFSFWTARLDANAKIIKACERLSRKTAQVSSTPFTILEVVPTLFRFFEFTWNFADRLQFNKIFKRQYREFKNFAVYCTSYQFIVVQKVEELVKFLRFISLMRQIDIFHKDGWIRGLEDEDLINQIVLNNLRCILRRTPQIVLSNLKRDYCRRRSYYEGLDQNNFKLKFVERVILTIENSSVGRHLFEFEKLEDFLTLERYLVVYFSILLRKLKQVNYQQSQRSKDISFL